MKNEKNIDNSIREKLENIHVPPPPHIWDNVQGRLAATRRRSRLVYMGWISAAAVIVLAFLAGWYFNDNIKTEKNISVTNEIIQPEKDNKESMVQSTEIASFDGEIEKNSETRNNTETAKLYGISADASNEVSTVLIDSKQIINSREIINLTRLKTADARVVPKQQPKTELAQSFNPISVKMLSEQEQLLIAENIKSIKVEAKPETNWKMGMFVAPGYSSYTASHTESYSQDMTYSSNNGNANVSGGFSVQYKTKKRWIFESGVYYAQSGQESDNSVNLLAANREADYLFAPSDMPYFNNNVRIENNNLAMNSTAGIIEFKATPRGAELSGEFDTSKSMEANIMVPDGQFSQVFEFMEIPLYVRYRVVDSKVGIEILTGLNAGIVVGNNAYINNQYGLQNIGETKDISTVNLSGTLGLGVNYALGKHFSIALEPRYSYYLNSINTNSSVDFRPYRIGFYTGVSYEF